MVTSQGEKLSGKTGCEAEKKVATPPLNIKWFIPCLTTNYAAIPSSVNIISDLQTQQIPATKNI